LKVDYGYFSCFPNVGVDFSVHVFELVEVSNGGRTVHLNLTLCLVIFLSFLVVLSWDLRFSYGFCCFLYSWLSSPFRCVVFILSLFCSVNLSLRDNWANPILSFNWVMGFLCRLRCIGCRV